MSFLNFIDTGFIFTLGLILVVGGGIMLYCYRRLNVLENSVIEHGKILHNFIANYNQSRQSPLPPYRNRLNTIEESVEDEDENINIKQVITNIDGDKIVVSDNESDDDNDSEEVSDEEVSDEEMSDMEGDIETIGDELDIQDDIVEADFDIKDVEDVKEFVPSMFQNMTLNTYTDNDNDNDSPIDISLETFSKIINLAEEEEKPKFNKMKVDELREYAVTHNFMNTQEANKLKKGDLLKVVNGESSTA